MEPTETNPLNPTFSRRLQSRMAVHNAPLWLRKAMFPGRALHCAKVAFNPVRGFMIPRQFGPINRKWLEASTCLISCSRSCPAGPSSAKPAEITMALRTPASTHSCKTSGTVAAGVITMARSTRSPIAATLA
jgi:hypothetical protein